MRILKALGKILLSILIIAVVALGTVAVWHVIGLRPFYQKAETAYATPGLDDSAYDQQGLCYDEDSQLFFYTGYMRDHTADPIYLANPDSGEVLKKVLLLDPNGNPQTSHAGGILVHNQFVYLAGSKAHCLYVYDKQTILDAANGASIPCTGVFQTGVSEDDYVKVSNISTDGDRLYVEEFHMPVIPSYQVLKSHEMTTSAGKTYALMVGFDFDDTKPFGLCETPSRCYALPDLVQGVAFKDGKIYLSKSIFYILSTISVNTAYEEGSYRVMNTEVPLYVFKEERSIKAPPMTEEIEFYNGKLYISSELLHYLVPNLGRLWNAQYCYRIDSESIR